MDSSNGPDPSWPFSGVKLTIHNIVLPLDKLSPTPSVLDNLDPEIEVDLRTLGCELIQESGILLKLPQVAMATAQILYQRFFYSKSLVRHFYELVICYLQALDLQSDEAIVQKSWNYMNDVLRTDAFVRHLPETIACGCVFLAARDLDIPLPSQPSWMEMLCVDEESVREVALNLLRMYHRPKPDVEKLEACVADLRKLQAEAKEREVEQKLAASKTINSKITVKNPEVKDEINSVKSSLVNDTLRKLSPIIMSPKVDSGKNKNELKRSESSKSKPAAFSDKYCNQDERSRLNQQLNRPRTMQKSNSKYDRKRPRDLMNNVSKKKSMTDSYSDISSRSSSSSSSDSSTSSSSSSSSSSSDNHKRNRRYRGSSKDKGTRKRSSGSSSARSHHPRSSKSRHISSRHRDNGHKSRRRVTSVSSYSSTDSMESIGNRKQKISPIVYKSSRVDDRRYINGEKSKHRDDNRISSRSSKSRDHREHKRR